MKKMLDYKTIFFAAALLFMTAPVFADGHAMTGQLPSKLRPGKASWGDQMKSGFNKFTQAILPEKEIPQKIDELSLSRKAKASPKLHVALAQSCEQQGQTQNAIIEYEKALKLDPNHEGTLLQYARFCDRINQSEKAEQLYKKAAKLHPRVAQVFNHQGLFFVRHQRYAEAAHAFSTAVALEPIKESYRGNLAVVLVDLGRHSEAYKQLRAVQSPDTAYYNLGFLLQERGKTTLAIKHFDVALKKNPDHNEARIWLNHLLAQQANPPEMVALRQQTQYPPQQVFPTNSQSTQVQTGSHLQPKLQVKNRVPQPTQQTASLTLPITQRFRPSQPEAPAPTVNVHQTPQIAPTTLNPQPSLNPQPTVTLTPPTSNQVSQIPPAPERQTTQPPTKPWQPRIPENTIAPVRTHSYYRSTIPPGRQQPYAVPIPGLVGSTAPHHTAAPAQNNQQPVSRTPAPNDQTNSTQVKPPSLIAPSRNRVPIRRLPTVTMRRTVNSASDRYITPLPPVDWSDTFKPDVQQ